MNTYTLIAKMDNGLEVRTHNIPENKKLALGELDFTKPLTYEEDSKGTTIVLNLNKVHTLTYERENNQK